MNALLEPIKPKMKLEPQITLDETLRFADLPILDCRISERYQACLEQSQTRLADASLTSRIAWQPGYNYRYLFVEDCFLSISDGGRFTTPHIYLPIGDLTLDRLRSCLKVSERIFANESWDLRVLFIDDHYKTMFKQLSEYEQEWISKEEFSDYVYDAEALRTLKGKKYRAKRNHINHFLREYPQFSYRSITKEDGEESIKLTKTWCMEHEVDCSDITQSDLPAIRNLFADFRCVDVRGGAIFFAGEMIAFALGCLPRPDYAVVHFEKAHPDFSGLYAVINQLVLANEFSAVEYVNREEDMGIAGIRTAKESYYPVEKLRKWGVNLKRKA